MTADTTDSVPTDVPAWRLWENPLLRRHARSRLRPRDLALGQCITLVLSAFIVGISYSLGIRNDADPANAARSAIIPLLLLQGFILFVMGTAQVSGGMITERDEGGVDYQRLVPMAPLTKVVGYLFGLPLREYLLAASSLPFTAWAMARGHVPASAWAPLYWVVFTTAVTYHATGLLTGTVVRNRRWAFLISIGMVFSLYTVIPQLAKFGLVFFKYLTITPVFYESLPDLLSERSGAALRIGQQFFPTPRFFDLGLPEVVFTTLSQAGLIGLFVVMLCRRWRQEESHLLSQFWAVGAYIAVQVVLLGHALPLIDPGDLFPSRNFRWFTSLGFDWKPDPREALAMIAVYGLFSTGLACVLAGIITPDRERQVRGWRRALKNGEDRLPPFGDTDSATLGTLVVSLAGGGGWYLFTRALLESRWFPGHHAGLEILVVHCLILFAVTGSLQALLDAEGGRIVGMGLLFVGVLPLLAGAIIAGVDNDHLHLGIWVAGVSPLSLPASAPVALLSLADSDALAVLPTRGAARFGWLVWGLVALWLTLRMRTRRGLLRRHILGDHSHAGRGAGGSGRARPDAASEA
ncbi:MAG: hypothetical protein RIT19_992 [Verrucomicrobiota bacterium]